MSPKDKTNMDNPFTSKNVWIMGFLLNLWVRLRVRLWVCFPLCFGLGLRVEGCCWNSGFPAVFLLLILVLFVLFFLVFLFLRICVARRCIHFCTQCWQHRSCILVMLSFVDYIRHGLLQKTERTARMTLLQHPGICQFANWVWECSLRLSNHKSKFAEWVRLGIRMFQGYPEWIQPCPWKSLSLFASDPCSFKETRCCCESDTPFSLSNRNRLQISATNRMPGACTPDLMLRSWMALK